MPPNLRQQLNEYGTLKALSQNQSSDDDCYDEPPKGKNPQEGQLDPSFRYDTLFKEVANTAASMLVWYAFAVFGYFSDVFGEEFFPPNVPENTALMESFAIFGGAFLMRPIGGIWMGYLGDKYSRKVALQVSLLLMAISTLGMGCVPRFRVIGKWSYVLLTFTRLIQGLSGGGQLMSSLVYAVESKPKEHWGLHGSYVMAAANFGNLMSGVSAFLLRKYFNSSQIQTWGWRLPLFLSGVLLFLCWYYLKYHCSEEDTAPATGKNQNDAVKKLPTNPLQEAFSEENRRPLLAACMVPVLYSAGFWLSFIWMSIYMYELIPDPIPQAFGITSSSLFLSVCVVFPVAGALSDRWGRKRIMTIGALIYGLGCPFLLIVIGKGNAILAFFAQSVMGVGISLWGGPMMAWLAESFPPAVRLTSAALGYNLGVGVFAGVSPAMATFLVDRWGYQAPGWWMTFLALLSLFGLWVVAPRHEIKEIKNRSNLVEDPEMLPFLVG